LSQLANPFSFSTLSKPFSFDNPKKLERFFTIHKIRRSFSMEASLATNKRSLSSTCHRAVFRNWKTTTIGLVLAFAGFVAYAPDKFGGSQSFIVELSGYIKIGGLAALGLTSKDFDKNGEHKS